MFFPNAHISMEVVCVIIWMTIGINALISCTRRNKQGYVKTKSGRARSVGSTSTQSLKEKHAPGGVTCLQVPMVVDCDDTGAEAKLRHANQKWYPQLQVLDDSLTNENHRAYMSIVGKVKHKAAEPFAGRPVRKGARVCFHNTCLVYVVYGDDVCRGLDEDENTVDDTSSGNGERIEKGIDDAIAQRESGLPPTSLHQTPST